MKETSGTVVPPLSRHCPCGVIFVHSLVSDTTGWQYSLMRISLFCLLVCCASVCVCVCLCVCVCVYVCVCVFVCVFVNAYCL